MRPTCIRRSEHICAQICALSSVLVILRFLAREMDRIPSVANIGNLVFPLEKISSSPVKENWNCWTSVWAVACQQFGQLAAACSRPVFGLVPRLFRRYKPFTLWNSSQSSIMTKIMFIGISINIFSQHIFYEKKKWIWSRVPRVHFSRRKCTPKRCRSISSEHDFCHDRSSRQAPWNERWMIKNLKTNPARARKRTNCTLQLGFSLLCTIKLVKPIIMLGLN